MTVTIDGLPASIRVGPYDIKIVAIEDAADQDDYGSFHSSEQEIGLQREFKTGPLAVDTLLHEILHAAWFAAALPSRCGEERAVSGLSPLVTQIVRDHPEILAWMYKALGK